MKTNPPVQDEVYRIVGEEVARKTYYPGPMARAVAEGLGNRDLVQSLYIRFRCEEVTRIMQRNALAEQERREREDEERRVEALRRKTENIFECTCGFSGKAKVQARGNMGIAVALSCLCIVPGLMYGLATDGYRAICPTCGRTLAEHVKPG
jgi:hypothetical protein